MKLKFCSHLLKALKAKLKGNKVHWGSMISSHESTTKLAQLVYKASLLDFLTSYQDSGDPRNNVFLSFQDCTTKLAFLPTEIDVQWIKSRLTH